MNDPHTTDSTSQSEATLPTARALTPKAKLAVEIGPLLVFFGTYFIAKRLAPEAEIETDAETGAAKMTAGAGLIWATGAFIVATLAALIASFSVERRVQPMTLVTAVLVVVLGGLTIYLDDETFIKRKPTFVSGLMGSILLVGLAFGRSLVQPLLSSSIDLDDQGWKKLTLRWALFFLVIAGLNEIVWRQMSTETWITYKTFGILPLTFIFLIAQAPLLERHRTDRGDESNDTPRP